MKISYNWLKAYIPKAPDAQKLADIFTYHVCEVESLEEKGDDTIFEIKILPNRAHDLLSHNGIAKELASLLNIEYKDPTPMYKIPESVPTKLVIENKTDKCRRYMGRIVRNIKVGPSPDWAIKHLESIGQRSINNIVDGTNLTMFDCGQPTHIFDLDKVKGKIIIREAKDGETMTTLDNKEVKLGSANMVIADEEGILAIAGVKGGRRAEVDENTKNIIIEVANFEPANVRKTAKSVGINTDAVKRYENDLSPELCSFAMREICGLFVEYGFKDFEDIVDDYPIPQKEHKLSFSTDKISSILGMKVSANEIEDILKRYHFEYKSDGRNFEIVVPPLRLDLNIEEDMAEEIGRVIGYDKLKPEIPKINFKPKQNSEYQKTSWARNKLLSEGYTEVMTYAFTNKGEVEILESASDKKFLRTNLTDGLKESIKLNTANAPLLGMNEVKIFEIGTVFKKDKEEIYVAYGDKKGVMEISLEEFSKDMPKDFSVEYGKYNEETKFKMWSLFPFISRDVAVWVPENISGEEVVKIIKENMGELVVRGPELFDTFKKDGKISYGYRLIFQSYERTLNDAEINKIMEKISIELNSKGWQVR